MKDPFIYLTTSVCLCSKRAKNMQNTLQRVTLLNYFLVDPQYLITLLLLNRLLLKSLNKNTRNSNSRFFLLYFYP